MFMVFSFEKHDQKTGTPRIQKTSPEKLETFGRIMARNFKSNQKGNIVKLFSSGIKTGNKGVNKIMRSFIDHQRGNNKDASFVHAAIRDVSDNIMDLFREIFYKERIVIK